jgi:integration host factor subunit beta
MNRTELIVELAHRMDITQREAASLVSAFVDSIVDGLESDGRVCIMGFGSFRKKLRPPRQGRNPKTGEKIMVESKNIIHFTPGKQLVEFVNSGE